MTREKRNTLIEYVILFALLATLLWCAIMGSIIGARNQREAERERYFHGATHSVPAMAFITGPGNPEDWTEDQWAEFVAMYATATPEEREAMDAWFAYWWPDFKMPISRAKRIIVGSEGRRHRYTRVHGVARQLI